jgi:hypothetical protein
MNQPPALPRFTFRLYIDKAKFNGVPSKSLQISWQLFMSQS